MPKGCVLPASPGAAGAVAPAQSPSAKDNLLTGRFAMMWLVFFCNMTAGIAIISFQSPLLQDLWKRIDPSLPARTLETHGAGLIAVSSLFNGLGRSTVAVPQQQAPGPALRESGCFHVGKTGRCHFGTTA